MAQIHDLATPRSSKGFIGERDDPETGLNYLHARYYDPALGRFISPDPWDPTGPVTVSFRSVCSFSPNYSPRGAVSL